MKDHPEPECCPDCEETIRELQKLVAKSEGTDRAYALFELGSAALFTGRDELALASFGACLEILPPGEDPSLESEALFKESCVLAILERQQEAIEAVSRAKKICKALGHSEHLALCEWREGVYHAELGETQIARRLLKAARDRFLKIRRPAAAALCELDLHNIESTPERVAFDPRRRKQKK